MKELSMHNGDVEDAQAHVCHGCQTPGTLTQADDGEWYHPQCVPEGL